MKSNLPIDEAIYEQGYNQAIKDLNDCDWQAFRREAAKDILCALIVHKDSGLGTFSFDSNAKVEQAIAIADRLIKRFKQE